MTICYSTNVHVQYTHNFAQKDFTTGKIQTNDILNKMLKKHKIELLFWCHHCSLPVFYVAFPFYLDSFPMGDEAQYKFLF